MLKAKKPTPNKPQVTSKRAKNKKKFNWRFLIFSTSIILAIVAVGLVAWRIKNVEPENISSAPKIQKITPEDVSFVKNDDSAYNFKAENQVFQAQFGLEEQKAAISFGVDQEKAIVFSYPTEKTSTSIVSDNKERITFKEVEKNIDIQYQVLPNGIKEEIILNKPRQKKDDSNIFSFEGNFQGAYAQKAKDGTTLNPIFYDKNDIYLFHFEKPFAIDKAGNRTDNVQFKIKSKGNETKYDISLVVDPEWLNSQDRVYPIIIDPTVVRQMATGGTITYAGGYTIHTFTSNGILIVNNALTAQVLVVAGGGIGGTGTSDCLGAGGAGAGGLIYNASFSIGAGSSNVTVGGAGANSAFSTLTASAGGNGGVSGANGGSGGGSMAANQIVGTGIAGQGNNGGLGFGTYGATCTSGGGGGGSSAVGAAGTGLTLPGAGGAGTSNSISGAAVTYAAGGAGGRSTGAIAGTAGAANTGNGGGGGSGGILSLSAPYTYSAGGAGGTGGSGIVIIRYVTEYVNTDSITTSSACSVKEGSTDNQLEVVWGDSSTAEDYYEVQRNVDGAGWIVLQTGIAANTTSFVDNSISSNHTYQYRVAPYMVNGPIPGTPYYAGWCTTNTLNLGVGDLNLGGLNLNGIDFN